MSDSNRARAGKKQIAVLLDQVEAELLDRMCIRMGWSMNRAIRECIQLMVSTHKIGGARTSRDTTSIVSRDSDGFELPGQLRIDQVAKRR